MKTAQRLLGTMTALMIACSTNAQSAPLPAAAVSIVLVHDVGETGAEVAPPMRSASDDLKPTKDGFVFLETAARAVAP